MSAPHEITRNQARAAGKLTDTLVIFRDELAAAGDREFADVVDNVIGLPTRILVDMADLLGIGGGCG